MNLLFWRGIALIFLQMWENECRYDDREASVVARSSDGDSDGAVTFNWSSNRRYALAADGSDGGVPR